MLRRLILGVCLVSTLATATVYYATRPHRIASMAVDVLERVTGADVHIASASFGLDGTVMVHDLRVRVPGIEGEGGRLFEADTALLKLDPGQAIRGTIKASELLLMRPTLSLTEIEEQQFNYEWLRRERGEVEGPIPDLPHIYLREGRLRYGEVHDGEYHPIGTLEVAGRLDPDEGRPGVYRFQLSPLPSGYLPQGEGDLHPDAYTTVTQPTLNGQFDLEQLEVSAELADFAFVDPHRNMLPREIRQWWDMFEPDGSLPNLRFDYDPLTGPTGTVHVEDVSLAIPQLGEADFDGRMEEVSGTFHFDADRIRIDRLEGRIEDLQYQVSGSIYGYSAEAPFQMVVSTRPFRIPEQPRFVPAMPSEVQRVFNEFTAMAWVRVSLAVSREEPNAEVEYHGSAQILSGKALIAELMKDPERAGERLDPHDPQYSSTGLYHKFPYPVQDMNGMVTFNHREVEVRRLSGRTPGGGTVSVAGTIVPPRDEAAKVDLTITAQGVPFSQTLYEALEERQREVADLFFDRDSYERLREAGHFASAREHDRARLRMAELALIEDRLDAGGDDAAVAEELALLEEVVERPVFDAGGSVDVTVHLHNDHGVEGQPGVRTVIDVAGLRPVFEHFPYPLTLSGGQLVITRDGVEVDGVRGKGLAGGEMEAWGEVAFVRDDPEAERPRLVPAIEIAVEGVPLDNLVVDAMPEGHGLWLADLNASGIVEVAGSIHHDAEREGESRTPLDYDLAIGVADAELAPGEGRYRLSGVRGDLRLTREGLEIVRMHGRRGEAEIEVSGSARFRGEDAGRFQLSGRGLGLDLADPVLDLVAPAIGNRETLEQLWERFDPAGGFDAAFEYEAQLSAASDEGAEAADYRIELEPASLAFNYGDKRVAMEDVSGSVRIDRTEVTLDGLAGRFDEAGAVRLDGGILYGEGRRRVRMSASLEGEGLSPTVRHLAPGAVGDLLERIEFAGAYRIDAPQIDVVLGEASEREVRVLADVQLEGAAVDVGVEVKDFEGSVAVDLRHRAGQAWPTFDLGMHATRMSVAGRHVRNVQLAMQNQEGRAAVAIPSLTARVAEGRAKGSGAVDLASGRFQLDLAVTDAKLGPLLNGTGPTHATIETDEETISVTHATLEEEAVVESASEGGEDLEGRVAMSLAVDGGWKDQPIRGRGELQVTHANLRGVPLAMGLLQVIHLTLPADQVFEQATSTYYIDGSEVIFESIQLDAPRIRIGGEGRVNYRSQELDLTLTTSNPGGLNLGPLTTLIDGLRDQLITLRVLGTIERPRLQVRQFNAITEAWRDVVGE